MLPSFGTGYNMIQRKIFTGAAILTLKIIALKDILPGKINALVGGVHISVETNDRRHGITLGNGSQLVPIRGAHHLTLVQVNKNKSPLYRANHQGAKILIQDQYPVVHTLER